MNVDAGARDASSCRLPDGVVSRCRFRAEHARSPTCTTAFSPRRPQHHRHIPPTVFWYWLHTAAYPDHTATPPAPVGTHQAWPRIFPRRPARGLARFGFGLNIHAQAWVPTPTATPPRLTTHISYRTGGGPSAKRTKHPHCQSPARHTAFGCGRPRNTFGSWRMRCGR